MDIKWVLAQSLGMASHTAVGPCCFPVGSERRLSIRLSRRGSIELYKQCYSTLLLATNQFLTAQLPPNIPPVPSVHHIEPNPSSLCRGLCLLAVTFSASQLLSAALCRSPLTTSAQLFLLFSFLHSHLWRNQCSLICLYTAAALTFHTLTTNTYPPSFRVSSDFSGLLWPSGTVSLLCNSNRYCWWARCSEAHFWQWD